MTSWAARFRRGATQGEIRVPFCPSCDRFIWYPRSACPQCLSTDLEVRPVPGSGIVRSWAVVHRSQVEALQEETPFAIGLVELDDGPIVVARISDEVRSGDRVVATFETVGNRQLPVFMRPDSE